MVFWKSNSTIKCTLPIIERQVVVLDLQQHLKMWFMTDSHTSPIQLHDQNSGAWQWYFQQLQHPGVMWPPFTTFPISFCQWGKLDSLNDHMIYFITLAKNGVNSGATSTFFSNGNCGHNYLHPSATLSFIPEVFMKALDTEPFWFSPQRLHLLLISSAK